MNKIPTAEAFAKPHRKSVLGYDVLTVDEAIEFAKLHVEAALKAAAENADLIDIDRFAFKIDKDTILNAYPLKNIK
jgi:hypothetical protein